MGTYEGTCRVQQVPSYPPTKSGRVVSVDVNTSVIFGKSRYLVDKVQGFSPQSDILSQVSWSVDVPYLLATTVSEFSTNSTAPLGSLFGSPTSSDELKLQVRSRYPTVSHRSTKSPKLQKALAIPCQTVRAKRMVLSNVATYGTPSQLCVSARVGFSFQCPKVVLVRGSNHRQPLTPLQIYLWVIDNLLFMGDR